ncbi:MAG: acyltransferase domain-containing protein [Telmatospirillum sp.]|nr:acyltransferase domain-containing protein [Telmatospirillum sp.]
MDASLPLPYEPIAIIGTGCRFPKGAGTGEDLWRLLRDGVDAVGAVPADRWDADAIYDAEAGRPGTTYCREGAFLDRIDGFDAAFFGFSPSEAKELDPQQRLLLEVAWESLADAGLPVQSLRGSRTGVFTGMLSMDYLALHSRQAGVDGINPYYATGKEFSFGAGRLSYHLGAHGPALTVSTACSSSLVALHLACRSLAARESDLALAGGVNLMLAPDLTVFMSQVRAISPTGRCHVFDAGADGIVRGEGCGIVVLKRLCDALADGDEIRAVIRGSAVNHDGASAGQTVPNGNAQVAVIRAALAAAHVQPRDIDYVEAHGTGTPLGDPIELDALCQVFRGRDEKLLVGSLKANFGHMDAAAGVAGLIKLVAAIRHGEIPPQIHLHRQTPAIDWDKAPIAVTRELRPWPDRAPDRVSVRMAGISAFGLSGTNVHVILSAPPASAPPPSGEQAGLLPARTPWPAMVPVSARSVEALRAQALRYADRIESAPAEDLPDILHTAACRRDHWSYRAVAIGRDSASLAADLRKIAEAAPRAAETPDDDEELRPVFVFTGQGAQWAGVAVDLLDQDPVFAATIRRCDAEMAKLTDWRIEEELRRPADSSRLSRTEIAQPVIFALQAALTERFRAWGVTPAAVVGHSMGEVAAAWCAGVLDLETGVRVIFHRADVMRDSAGSGRMLATALAGDALAEVLSRYPDLDVAAFNSPASVVLAGPEETLTALAADLTRQTVFALLLPGAYAFHSRQMEPYRAPLIERLKGLSPSGAEISWISSCHGPDGTPVGDAAYWADNIRQPVRFRDAIDRLTAKGHRLFLEIGPHAVLAPPVTQCLQEKALNGHVASALVRGRAGLETVAAALAGLHAGGAHIDWNAVHPAGRLTGLPSYPWQHRRFWFDAPDRAPAAMDLSQLVAEVRILDRTGRVLAEAGGITPTAGTPRPAPMRDGPARPAAAPVTVDAIEAAIDTVLRDLLGLDEAMPVDRGRGFFELGLTSIMLVELRQALQARFGCGLPATIGFDFPTVHRLAAFIAEKLALSTPEQGAESPPVTVATGADGRRDTLAPDPVVAVIGIGCRFPEADTPDAFWSLLEQGRIAVRSIPGGRWADADYPEAGNGRFPDHAGFLDDPGAFDADFFQISPKEALRLDPQQRLFLTVAWEALERAGIAPDRLQGSRTGVFAGVNSHDYDLRIAADPGRIDAYWGTGTSFSAVSGRLSHSLGLQGPSLTVDTACSSSLTAIHLACQSLLKGECDLAMAGGVNVIASPAIFRSMGDAGALAPDGRCKTFDDSADGYGRGEGCGVVVLKPLARAIADGDRIIATILGSAVNHDGPSAGLTVPNGPAQQALIRDSLAAANRKPAEIGYVESHGTGTVLGDPIEIQAMDAVYGTGRDPRNPLRIGALKSNIGHLEAAAGIAAFIKACLCVQKGVLPPHPAFETPNRRVDWTALKVRVPTTVEPWAGQPAERLAGISAFGFTGTNVHVVIAGHDDGAASSSLSAASFPETAGADLPLVLSARTPTALRTHALQIARWLRETQPDAGAVCRTAARGRAQLPQRLAVWGSRPDDLAAALENWLDGRPIPENGRTGRTAALVGRFLAGMEVDWRELWPLPGPVADLPTNPWEPQSYWIAPATPVLVAGTGESRDTGRSCPLLREPPLTDGDGIGWTGPCGDDSQLFSLSGTGRRLRPAALAELALAAMAKACGTLQRQMLELWISPGPDIGLTDRLALHLRLELKDDRPVAIRIDRSLPDSGWQPCLIAQVDAVTPRDFGEQRDHDHPGDPGHHDGTIAIPDGLTARERRIALIEASVDLLAADFNRNGGVCSGLTVGNGVPDGALAVRHRRDGTLAVEAGDGTILLVLSGLSAHAGSPSCADTTTETITGTITGTGTDAAGPEARTYTLAWWDLDQPVPPATPAGFWLLIGDREDLARPLVAAAATRGVMIRTVAEERSQGTPDGHWDPAADRRLQRLLREQAMDPRCQGVLHAAGLGLPDGLPDDPTGGLLPRIADILALSRAASAIRDSGKPILFLTEQAVEADGPASRPAAASIWGLVRCFGLEHPAWWRGVADIDLSDGRNLRLLADLLAADLPHDHLLLRDGTLRAAQVVEQVAPPPRHDTLPKDGCVILHDAAPDLAPPILQWLAGTGVGRVALLGGDPSVASADAGGPLIERLEISPDDREALAGEIARLRAGGPIVGVIHGGHDWTMTPLASMSETAMAETLKRRAGVVVALHRLTRSDPIRLFATFGSAAALWGGMGMGRAAAVDAFADALAETRRGSGRPSVSIAWTQWDRAVRNRPDDLRLMRQSGLDPLKDETALACLDRLVWNGPARAGIAAVDWAVLRPLYQAVLPWPVLDQVGQRPDGGTGEGSLRRELEALSPELRRHRLMNHVRKVIADVFGYDAPDELDVRRGFFDMGMTSMMAVDLRSRLERLSGLSLPSTFAFERTSIEAVVTALIEDGFTFTTDAGPTAGSRIVERPVQDQDRNAGTAGDMTDDQLLDALSRELQDLDGVGV